MIVIVGHMYPEYQKVNLLEEKPLSRIKLSNWSYNGRMITGPLIIIFLIK